MTNQENSLQEKIEIRKSQGRAKISAELLKKLGKATQDLSESGLVDAAPKKGDKLKNFSLPNHLG